MFFASYGCSFIGEKKSTASFRTVWGIQFVPAILLLLGLLFLPRSPRWLANVGRAEEAIDVLAKIQAGGNKDDLRVIVEWDEIITTLRAEQESLPGWHKFVKKGMWKRTLAGVSVQVWQQLQLSGANTR